MQPATILFVGGGSLGHLMPSLAVEECLRTHPGVTSVFVCARRPEETQLLSAAGHRFFPLSAPVSPRRFSLETALFPFRFLLSFLQAYAILRRTRPSIVFAKGGSVSVPVCLAAALRGIAVVLHESDDVPSMGGRLIARFARLVCTGFEPAVSDARYRRTGNPVRAEIMAGSKAAGQRITGFSGRRPIVMVIGGSLGSVALNEYIVASLDALLETADIIHLTGRGKLTTKSHARYFVREGAGADLPHLYALADLVVSRAGAGVLSELAALSKASIIVPLTGVGHDHQLRNAEAISRANAAILLPQERLETLPSVIASLLADAPERQRLGSALHRFFPPDAAQAIAAILLAEISKPPIQS